ncbi:Endonuclease/exonuclease/phosphatase [Pelagophyceae sp. CCMP2097]|nr:Endonuclease/exonuclease/phosphatase [Pelagophyceae sp. CCMP2097]
MPSVAVNQERAALFERMAQLSVEIDECKSRAAPAAVDPEGGSRSWVVSKRHDGTPRSKFTVASAPRSTFTVASYNVEADTVKDACALERAGLRKAHLKPGTDFSGVAECVDEMLKTRPDICCFQELQRCPFGDAGRCEFCTKGTCRRDHAGRLHRKLAATGYSGEYKRDGKPLTVGVYFKKSTFTRIHVGFVTFDKPQFVAPGDWHAWSHGEAEGSSQKGAVMALVQHRETRAPVLICSVHLDVPKGPGGACTTVQQLLGIKQMRRKIEDLLLHPRNMSEFGTDLSTPVIIGTDLNSLPYDHYDPVIARADAYNEMLRRRDAQTRLEFASAYRDVLGNEPCFTSVDPKFMHTIDYIFYTKALRPVAVLDVVASAPRRDGPCWPSDHLRLEATFEFAPGWAPPVCKFGDQCLYHLRGRCRSFHPKLLPRGNNILMDRRDRNT